MTPGFLLAAPTPALRPSRTRACTCTRRRPPAPARAFVRMGVTQRKDEDATPELDQPSAADKLVPPSALPTLSTLSDSSASRDANADVDIDLSLLSGATRAPAVGDEDPGDGATEKELATMGAGLAKEDELFVIRFIKECYQELLLIEWPSVERVVKITLLIMVTLTVSVVSLYFIDGFFYRISQAYFEAV